MQIWLTLAPSIQQVVSIKQIQNSPVTPSTPSLTTPCGIKPKSQTGSEEIEFKIRWFLANFPIGREHATIISMFFTK